MGSTVGFCSFCTQHEIARFSLLRPSLPLSLKPRQRLLLILTSTATEDTDWDTDTVLEDTTVDTVLATTASVRLRLPPRLRQTPTFCMVVDTMVMDWDTTVLATGDTTTARGRLGLPPRLRLTPTFCMVDTMDWDTEDTTVFTDIMATTMARGRLRLPPRLRLTPTFCMVDMVLDMVILATATVLATGDTTGDKLPTPLQDLNHRRKTLTLFV